MVTLADSGYIKPTQYESDFNKIYFDAKIELKKQQAKEQKTKEQSKDGDAEDDYNYHNYSNHKDELDGDAILLIPFYDKNPAVPKFFDKLLKSSDQSLQLNTALLLIKNNKPVNDSLLLSLAADDQYRSILYYKLEKMKRLDKFPAKYKTQLDIARSDLTTDKDYYKLDSIVFISKELTTYAEEKGFVYFFKYRVKKEDGWKIGICGLQPENPNKINGNDKLIAMTDKKLKDGEPEDAQLQEQLKKLQFIAYKSAANFYDSDNGYRFKRIADYGN